MQNTFETDTIRTINGSLYVLTDGELFPAVYGGAETQESSEDNPPPQFDPQAFLGQMSTEFGKTLSKSLKPVQDQLKELNQWRQTVDARFTQQGQEEEDDDTQTENQGEQQRQQGEQRPQKAKPTAAEAAMKRQLRDMSERLNTLTAENQASKKSIEEATRRERLSNRDRQLSDALSSLNGVGVVSLDGGIRFFKDDLAFDEESEDWFYSTKDGARYTIAETVQKFTPDWLKKAQGSGGGSGNAKPGTGAAAHKAEVQRLRALKETANNSKRQADAAVYWRERKAALAAGMTPAELDATG